MADAKLTALTADTAPTKDDLLYLVTDPAGTPASRKVTMSDLVGGWIGIADSWTYASTSTINIPTDGTVFYQKGVKIRFKQGAGYKYYVASTVAATLLTVFVNTDYTVANAAITDIAYSYSENPLGFPTEFNWNWNPSGITTTTGTTTAKYSVNGGMVHGHVDFLFGASSAVTGAVSFTLPAAVTSYTVDASSRRSIGRAAFLKTSATAGVYTGDVGVLGSSTTAYIRANNSSGTYGELTVLSSTVPFTWVTTDSIGIEFNYAW